VQSAPLVSVVTPFYNTCDYLAECIESVLRQTHANWEYVLVDNCSTDGSSEIAAEYAGRFPDKIHVVRPQAFLSQVQNYNFALTCISPESKYCKMVQADDWLFPECIKSMVQAAEEHPSVGIVAAYLLEGNEVRLGGLPYATTALSGRDVCRLYFLKGTYLFGSPSSILIRSDLARSRMPFFDERYAPFEDGHACFDLLASCDFGFVHQVLTYSRSDNAGIMSRIHHFGLAPFLHFSTLVAHGREHLSTEEYDRCFRKAKREYFVHLAKAACALRPESREFWDFHRKGMAGINYSLDWKRLARWLPRAVVEKAWEALWRRWDEDSQPDKASASRQTETKRDVVASPPAA
jgi:glycosyltransferase involved in cell wall biosynthesis